PLAAALDDVAHRAERQEAALLLLFFEDDLRERDGRQIFFRLVIDDLDVIAIANHLADLVERDVPAVLRIVELAVRVALDDPRVRHDSPSDYNIITQRVISSTCHNDRVGPDLIISRLRAIREPRMRVLALVSALGGGELTD